MTLSIFNTLSRRPEPFEPLEPGHVRMYVCGMTVYDLCHLGHARSMLAFDVVQRWLKASGYRVTYVRNVTDIDDKIIARALKNGETITTLTNRMIDALHQDADALGIERPTFEPRATEYVPQMLDIIRRLEDKGLAYRVEGGDVNYAVRKFPGYGKLSGKSLDDLRAGERVGVPWQLVWAHVREQGLIDAVLEVSDIVGARLMQALEQLLLGFHLGQNLLGRRQGVQGRVQVALVQLVQYG